jgi:hypothetical protein
MAVKTDQRPIIDGTSPTLGHSLAIWFTLFFYHTDPIPIDGRSKSGLTRTKKTCVSIHGAGPIPTLASSSNCMCSKGLGVSESQWLTVFGLFHNCATIRQDSPAIA